MKEIVIFPDPANTNDKKGHFFEKLLNRVFSQQRFNVTETVNFTGMEIDLICEHMDRKEIAYAECKACESLSSDMITQFMFKVDFRKANHGYFIHTKRFQHQVAGLITEIQKDGRYKHVYFWDAEKVIELLVASKEISAFDEGSIPKYSVNKVVLLYTYLGTFYIPLLSKGTMPEFFSIVDASKLTQVNESVLVDKIKAMVKEINTLEFIDVLQKQGRAVNEPKNIHSLETVAEIQESESWDDYKPASAEFFVGRSNIKESILKFFERVLGHKTSKRIFYIDGKSGWGKSSLINKLKGSTYYKNKYYIFAVDSRSANSESFVALAFKKMLEKATQSDFIKSNKKPIKILSNYDILGDDSVKSILRELVKKKKLLIIIFDQFEDIFRKGTLFDVFYKFLCDLRDINSNIVLGFSWKSEINVPIEHEAYYLWQQAKEYADSFNISEFETTDSRRIIATLEDAIGEKLEMEFVRKVIDNSQGFPWLVKKLCIHLYKQFKDGVSTAALYEKDLNVELLFKDDLQGLSSLEVKTLKHIARRSYENNAFDAIEVDDTVSEEVLSVLINKRLIIKSGTKYNIYWDIFRDYLVNGEVPKIGETYLLRQNVQPVLDMFLLFDGQTRLKIGKISQLMALPVQEGSILNTLRELVNIGLLSKEFGSDEYVLTKEDIDTTESSFKSYIHDKIQNNSLYLDIQNNVGKKIDLTDLKRLIKLKFKSQSFSDKTLSTYSQIFVNWIKYAGLETAQFDLSLTLQAHNLTTFTPQFQPQEDIDYFRSIKNEQDYPNDPKIQKILYDLKSIGLLNYYKNKIYLTPTGISILTGEKNLIDKSVCTEALKTEKLSKAYLIIKDNPDIKIKPFRVKVQDMLVGIKSVVYKSITARTLFVWGKFIYGNQHEAEAKVRVRKNKASITK